jgi:hypothetical protein
MSIIARNNVNVRGDGQRAMVRTCFGCDQNIWRHVTAGEPGFGRRYPDGSIWSAVCGGVTEEVGRKRATRPPSRMINWRAVCPKF